MSKKSELVVKNHRYFQANVDNIINYGLNIVKEANQDKAYKSILLEGLLLKSCALWESFIEDEIVFLVNLEPNQLINEMGLSDSTSLNLKLIRALLFSDTYRNYYNIEQSKPFFKKILPDKYNLFKRINKDQSKKIAFVYILRNYLSHRSLFSRKQLVASYKEIYGYTKFIEPGSFLLSKKGKHFEKLFHNFKLTSLSMERFLTKGDQ